MNEGCFTVIIFGLIIFVSVIISYVSGNLECSEVGKVLNYKTEWHYWTGCIVEKPDGSKVLLRQMRAWEGEK